MKFATKLTFFGLVVSKARTFCLLRQANRERHFQMSMKLGSSTKRRKRKYSFAIVAFRFLCITFNYNYEVFPNCRSPLSSLPLECILLWIINDTRFVQCTIPCFSQFPSSSLSQLTRRPQFYLHE